MRSDKGEAIILRKSGKSYKEIRRELGVPLSTLSDWFRNLEWSQKTSENLNRKNLEASRLRIIHLGKIRGDNLKKLYRSAREEAAKDFSLLKHHPLFVAGVMIYWREGDKASKNSFRISNSDPVLVKIFLSFLRKVCGAEESRIRAGLLLYPDLDPQTCEVYWSEKIGLDIRNFTKSIVIRGKHKTKRVSHGICTLNFSSRFLKEKMLIWMSLMADDQLKI